MWERHCNMSRMNWKVNRSRFKETPPSNAMKKFEALHIWDNFAMNFTSIIHSWPQRRAAHKGEWVVLIWYYRGDHERPAWHVTMMMGWISKSGLLSGLTRDTLEFFYVRFVSRLKVKVPHLNSQNLSNVCSPGRPGRPGTRGAFTGADIGHFEGSGALNPAGGKRGNSGQQRRRRSAVV